MGRSRLETTAVGSAGEAVRGSRPGARWRGLLGNAALLATSAVVFLVLAEMFLRTFPGFLGEEAALRVHWAAIAGDTDSEGRALMLDDPEIGFLYKPGLEGRLARGDLDFSFRLDGRGFRNPEPWPERVGAVLLGDSMAFGYGASDGSDWPSLLRARLPSVGIVNLALIGSGPLQQAKIFERYGRALGAPVVVHVLFPGNDMADDAAFSRWLQSDRRISYRKFRGQGDRWLDDSVLGWAQRTHLFWFTIDLVRTVKRTARGHTLTLEDGTRLRLVAPRTERIDPVELDRTLGAVEHVRSEVERVGGRFFVVLMPTKEDVYLPLAGVAVPNSSAAVREQLERRGVPLLDLGEILRAEASPRGPALYFEVDGHPNLKGQAIIAEAVAAWLEDVALQAGSARATDADQNG
ncbi:MAG: GDSL-type esterase/lipase family protein [Geminicoccaceae bacterium]|nr:GDSL-type esterase/lipase family protein [Geminicoccaceae bacterium]